MEAPVSLASHRAMSEDTLNDLAAVAHRLWCARMLSNGWTYADRFDAALHTHDALVPFTRLERRDQRAARLGVLAEELESRLISAIRYSRGPNREFLIEEVVKGRKVAFCPNMKPPPRASVQQEGVGEIDSWTVDSDGELDLIRVRWPDGQVTDHVPGLLELARLEELA